MRRTVDAPNNLTWTVRRLIVPFWMRPIGLGTATRPYVGQRADSVGGGTFALGLPAMLFGLVAFAVCVWFLPLVLLLRKVKLVPWTLQAVTRPWGRRGPATVLRYEVKGNEESKRALDELAEKLARGDGAPVLAGAERIA